MTNIKFEIKIQAMTRTILLLCLLVMILGYQTSANDVPQVDPQYRSVGSPRAKEPEYPPLSRDGQAQYPPDMRQYPPDMRIVEGLQIRRKHNTRPILDQSADLLTHQATAD